MRRGWAGFVALLTVLLLAACSAAPTTAPTPAATASPAGPAITLPAHAYLGGRLAVALQDLLLNPQQSDVPSSRELRRSDDLR